MSLQYSSPDSEWWEQRRLLHRDSLVLALVGFGLNAAEARDFVFNHSWDELPGDVQKMVLDNKTKLQ